MSLKASTLIVLALAALALAFWFGRHQPAVQRALPPPLRSAVQQALPQAAPAAASARKCRRGEQVLYTDGPCPAGSHEQALAGGSVSVLPAPAAAASPASASTPLRRLAGDGALPDHAERSVEQALKR